MPLHFWGASRGPGNTEHGSLCQTWTMDEVSCNRCLYSWDEVCCTSHLGKTSGNCGTGARTAEGTTRLQPRLPRGSAYRCWDSQGELCLADAGISEEVLAGAGTKVEFCTMATGVARRCWSS